MMRLRRDSDKGQCSPSRPGKAGVGSSDEAAGPASVVCSVDSVSPPPPGVGARTLTLVAEWRRNNGSGGGSEDGGWQRGNNRARAGAATAVY